MQVFHLLFQHFEFDTYYNGNNSDVTNDHLAIQLDGSQSHTSGNMARNMFGLGEIEDGSWYDFRITWDHDYSSVRGMAGSRKYTTRK